MASIDVEEGDEVAGDVVEALPVVGLVVVQTLELLVVGGLGVLEALNEPEQGNNVGLSISMGSRQLKNKGQSNGRNFDPFE